ncbi:MAG: quinolinate synthase NadA [Fimbriimonadaceae bacterium]|nr:quinolinate synthase NadA [Fimbriimonadaceae bacterium]QYK58342.1 MAG: quinolinate synthase NadA [Fimbriimonadaceae bacterium]
MPPEFAALSDSEASDRIRRAKQALGSRLVILGHHYQRDEIIQHADFRGDSYKLAQDALRRPEADFIVFCGVHFMAESADILTPEHQVVILPNLAAGCSMADMANIFQVRNAWKQLGEVLGMPLSYPLTPPSSSGTASPTNGGGAHASNGLKDDLNGVGLMGNGQTASTVVPVTYINSAASLKAFVGEHGGTVCTSTNAPVAVRWALDRAEKVLFFPDQHLGRNTGVKLGFDPEADMALWDPFKPLGGNTPEKLRAARILLWKGHCSVHKRFTLDQALAARRDHPGVHVLVHPECDLSLVREADFVGSTEYIIRTVEGAAPGSVWAVGTEINLVSRLAAENPNKTVFCLDPQICPCSTMYRIHPSFLCWALENLVEGRIVNQIKVPEPTASLARVALARMLELAPAPSAAHVD